MLEKLLNKKVVIVEKIYGDHLCSADIKKGIVTDMDKDFIELDNSMIISKQCIYTIEVL